MGKDDFAINAKSIPITVHAEDCGSIWGVGLKGPAPFADTGGMTHYLIVTIALAVNPPAGFDPTPILDAIEHVETGAEADPANAVGDGGKALGPMQIHRVYWADAVEHDPSLVANGETYQSVRNRTYARRVVMAYMSRYAKTWSAEEIARLHNGGPAAMKAKRKHLTDGYWAKVQKALDLTR